jgi:hypothetical protein
MIEVRQKDGYYNWTESNIQMVVDELKNNHFEIELSSYHRTIVSSISCGYSSVKIPIVRGDFRYTLFLSYREYDIKKEKIKFDAILEEGKWKGVFFDIEKVIVYYEKWDKRNKQKTVRENVSQFKGPLVLSYIRGTLEAAEIEYKEEQSYSRNIFKTNTYCLEYREPPPGELAKLNMERVELILTTNDKKVNYVPVPLKKFVENGGKVNLLNSEHPGSEFAFDLVDRGVVTVRYFKPCARGSKYIGETVKYAYPFSDEVKKNRGIPCPHSIKDIVKNNDFESEIIDL